MEMFTFRRLTKLVQPAALIAAAFAFFSAPTISQAVVPVTLPDNPQADELPTRKAGLWEQKANYVAGQRPIVTRNCIDATSERKGDVFVFARKSQSKLDFRKTANGYTIDTKWSNDRYTMERHGELVGDLDSSYTYEVKYTDNFIGTHVERFEGKWLGACPAGWKPGDQVLAADPVKTGEPFPQMVSLYAINIEIGGFLSGPSRRYVNLVTGQLLVGNPPAGAPIGDGAGIPTAALPVSHVVQLAPEQIRNLEKLAVTVIRGGPERPDCLGTVDRIVKLDLWTVLGNRQGLVFCPSQNIEKLLDAVFELSQ